MSFLHDQVLTTDEKREFQCLQQYLYLDSDSFCATVAELEDGSRAVRLGLLLTERQHIWTSLHVSSKEGNFFKNTFNANNEEFSVSNVISKLWPIIICSTLD